MPPSIPPIGFRLLSRRLINTPSPATPPRPPAQAPVTTDPARTDTGWFAKMAAGAAFVMVAIYVGVRQREARK
ncbi:hypothetical protein DFJ74DRAFT_705532 [Hyaloraphidium curvatum]|nr:hypothetical protein DFJ74DRAFT_705532 [Hyaloraphidium curvatum]